MPFVCISIIGIGLIFDIKVRLNNTIWCVRDGGEWSGCDDGSKPKDLIKAVNRLYKDSDGNSENSDYSENAIKEL